MRALAIAAARQPASLAMSEGQGLSASVAIGWRVGDQRRAEAKTPRSVSGANASFTARTLLTAANAGDDKDEALFAELGVRLIEAAQSNPVAAE